MKKIFLAIFDLLFPRRENDAAIADISAEDFYEKIPRWQQQIYPDMRAIFHYKNPTAKAMIKELKSSKNRHAAEIAAYALANHLEENNLRDAIIVPMPISKKRRKKRGYNQCELITEFFVKEIITREQVMGNIVIPAQAGILSNNKALNIDSIKKNLGSSVTQDSRFRGNDKKAIMTTLLFFSFLSRGENARIIPAQA
jgi:hypothetical protein